MDPNKCLEEILAYADDVLEGDDDCQYELAERIQDLHGWLKSGGFLPEAWQKNREK